MHIAIAQRLVSSTPDLPPALLLRSAGLSHTQSFLPETVMYVMYVWDLERYLSHLS